MSAQNTNQYPALYESFEWFIPTHFNIAHVCSHRWAASPHEARQAAIYFEDQVGQLTMLSYGQLSEKVNKLANAFVRMGVQPQDRIAIALQHSAETAVTILAAITMGAIAVPLGTGLSNTEYDKRLVDAGARVAVVDKHTIAAMTSAIDHNPQLRQSLRQIVGIHTEDERVIPWRTLLARQPSTFTLNPVEPSAYAIMLYPPVAEGEELKATLISHQALLGALPGFVASQNWFPKGQDLFFTSYDWSTPMGLLNALLPTLYFGRTIVGCPSGRTIPRLFTLLEHYQITNILTSRHELTRIKEFNDPLNQFELQIRCIALPDDENNEELIAWVDQRFGATLNSIFAPLGFSYIIGECPDKWPSVAGSMGKVFPGHKVAILNDDGLECQEGEIGYLCVSTLDIQEMADPGLAKHFWATGRIQEFTMYETNWYNTGCRAYQKDGYFWREPAALLSTNHIDNEVTQ